MVSGVISLIIYLIAVSFITSESFSLFLAVTSLLSLTPMDFQYLMVLTSAVTPAIKMLPMHGHFVASSIPPIKNFPLFFLRFDFKNGSIVKLLISGVFLLNFYNINYLI